MIWLLTEILVYVLAAAVFGLLIGMGLAGSARRGAAPSRDQAVQLEELQQARSAQRQTEAKARAMAAAEAAARGDLEARLVDAEATMLEFRSRAESAELRLRALQNPVEAPPAALAGPDAASAEGPDTATLRAAVEAAERARAAAEAEQLQAEQQREAALEAAARSRDEARAVSGLMAQEIESLRAQLAAAEAMRSASESALATLRAEGEVRAQPPSPASPSPAAPPPAAPPPSSAMPAFDPALRAAASAPVLSRSEPPPTAAPSMPLSGPFFGSAPAPGSAGRWAEPAVLDGDRPVGIAAPRGGRPDDLRRIKGIGPKNEGVLNSLGIYHYDQIAALSAGNVAWLDAFLKFHGRIAREDWVGQAKALVLARTQPLAESKVHPDDAGA